VCGKPRPAPQLLADARSPSLAWNGRILTDPRTQQAVQDHLDAQGLDWDWWAMRRADRGVDLAYKFVSYSSQPARWPIRQVISYGANKDAVPKLIRRSADCDAPDNMKSAPSRPTLGDNATNDRRFNAWLAKVVPCRRERPPPLGWLLPMPSRQTRHRRTTTASLKEKLRQSTSRSQAFAGAAALPVRLPLLRLPIVVML